MKKDFFLKQINYKKNKIPVCFYFMEQHRPEMSRATVTNIYNKTNKYNVSHSYRPISKMIMCKDHE